MHNRQFLAVFGLVLILTSGSVWAKEINVPADFKTIVEALSNASAGDVIKVAEGTYTENLTITVSVTLEGAGAEKTIIDGINGQSQNQPTLTIQNIKNVTVRGFTIQNGGRRGVLITRSTGVVLENNALKKNRRVGLGIESQSEVKILSNQIVETIKEADGAGGRGLQVVESEVVITGNTVSKNAEDGVDIFSSKVEIRDNQINENALRGISLVKLSNTSPASSGIITGNTLNANTAQGILVRDESNGEISKNQITNTKSSGSLNTGLGEGIVVQGKGRAKLSENTIISNASSGVAVFDATAELVSNIIKDNQGCGVSGNNAAVITGSNNEISGNLRGDLCGSAPSSIKK